MVPYKKSLFNYQRMEQTKLRAVATQRTKHTAEENIKAIILLVFW